MLGDEQYALIRELAITIVAMGGTSFREADLTGANFSYASLRGTDFRNATLKNVCWYQTKHINLACFGDSYLKFPPIQKLVRTKQAKNLDFRRFSNLEGINLQDANLGGSNFSGVNLRGANLQGADLSDVDFSGADLSQANLQEANLSRTKLVQTRLDQAILIGAVLTGAYIEDWGITAETKLESVKCRYVFMHLPTQNDPDPCRKPDNKKEEFSDGDFADFIAPLIKTLDLYHNQDIDPRVVALAYNHLRKSHPEAALEIVAVEKRGRNRDKLLLRAETTSEANRSELCSEYFSNYNQLKSLPEEALKLLLEQRDAQIRMLAGWVDAAIKRPGIYAQTYQSQGDTMSEIHKGNDIRINGTQGNLGAVVGGDNSGVAGQEQTGVAGNDINGIVTTSINQLHDMNEPKKSQLADLLKQLKTAIEQSDLDEKDKVKALKHINAIAKHACNQSNSDVQEATETALDALTGIFGKANELLKSYLPLLQQIQLLVFPF
jgi:hypothetical protein